MKAIIRAINSQLAKKASLIGLISVLMGSAIMGCSSQNRDAEAGSSSPSSSMHNEQTESIQEATRLLTQDELPSRLTEYLDHEVSAAPAKDRFSMMSEMNEQPPALITDVQDTGMLLEEPLTKLRALPEGFVYLDEVVPNLLVELRYFTDYNFVGTRIDGYLSPFAIGTSEMGKALADVSLELNAMGYQLLVYDSYRPAKAVAQFVAWSKDAEDTLMKELFYPNMDKDQLFKSGYLSSKSGHSRGSTIDVTLVDSDSKEPVDMGGTYDLLDERSHYQYAGLSAKQQEHRALLKTTMEKHGFKAYSKEWWHFTLKNEPYPQQYFDFDVE